MNIFPAILALGILAIGGGVYYQETHNQDTVSDTTLTYPLSRGEEREKKLTFGLYVTPNPEQNPIDPPERFTGYHTALDFEIFPEEETTDVAIMAACTGTILQTEVIAGYGGVIIQSCRIENQEVTVLYGHLDYTRFQKEVGNAVRPGEQIGFLGDGKSPESGDTRKHLHFGIHKGTEIEVKGYVENEAELQSFINPLPLLQ